MNQQLIFSPDAKRADFRRVELYLKEIFNNSNFIINQDTLRVEQVLSATQGTYNFDLYEGTQSTDRPLEKKLNRNDLFFATHFGLCITKQDDTNDNYGNYPLFTYPEPEFFLGNDGASLLEWEALETVFAGKLSFKTKSVERITDFLTHNFRYVPERVLSVSTTNSYNTHPQYGPTDEARGYYQLTPSLVIDGNQNNTVNVALGRGDRTVIAGGIDAANLSVDTSNVLVLLLHGFSVSNAAEKENKWSSL